MSVLMDAKPLTSSQVLQFDLDFRSAIFGAHQHVVRFQFLRIILRASERYLRSTEKAVSPRESIGLRIAEREAQRLAAKQRHDPADRTDKMQSRRPSPIHCLGPGDLLDRPRQELLQYLLRRLPLDHPLCREVLALGRRYQG